MLINEVELPWTKELNCLVGLIKHTEIAASCGLLWLPLALPICNQHCNSIWFGGQILSFLHTVGFLNPFEWAVRLPDWDLLHEPECMASREQALSIQKWLLLRGDSRSATIYSFYTARVLKKNIVILQIIWAIISPFSVPFVFDAVVFRSNGRDAAWIEIVPERRATDGDSVFGAITSGLPEPGCLDREPLCSKQLLHQPLTGLLLCDEHHRILYITRCTLC